MHIFDEINHFRNAIDIAKENDEFRKIYPFYKFPDDCCEHTCDLLGQYLLERGIETSQVNGSFKDGGIWHHVWLLTNDGLVIDITGDQFIGKISQLNENPKRVYVGEEGELQKLFCVNRCNNSNTNFMDKNEFTNFGGQPNARQKTLIEAYEIISQYL